MFVYGLPAAVFSHYFTSSELTLNGSRDWPACLYRGGGCTLDCLRCGHCMPRWWADEAAVEDGYPTGFSRSHGLFMLSTLRISPSLVSCCDRRLMFPSTQRVYRPTPTRCRSSVTVALILLLGGVELNPGPAVSSATIPRKQPSSLQVGCLNCRSAAPKIALIHDLISDYALDILFLSETWFNTTTPQSVLLDVAPSEYATLHVVRLTPADRLAVVDLACVSVTLYLSVNITWPANFRRRRSSYSYCASVPLHRS